MSLHQMWITRYNYIYMQIEEEVSIEELNELKLELEDLLLTIDFKYFLEIKNISFPSLLDSISALVIKG